MLLSSALQPSIVSVFSSTSSDPLSLFSFCIDQALPSDSLVQFLHDRLSIPTPTSPGTLVNLPTINNEKDTPDYGVQLEQTVLHIQSPTIRTTYVQCPPVLPPFGALGTNENGLGIKHPWMHLQVRNIRREWSFEVGIMDVAGRTGIIRFSTFQKCPRLKLNHKKAGSPPLLLLPISFPLHTTLLTPWSTINVHLPTLLPYFSSPLLRTLEDDHPSEEGTKHSWGPRPNAVYPMLLPGGIYSSVSYIRVYANCRLRRIWFGDSGPTQKIPWEFELFSDNQVL